MHQQVRAVHIVCREKLVGVGTHYGVMVEYAGRSIEPECWELNIDGLRRMTLGEFGQRRRVVREVSITDLRAVNAAIQRLNRSVLNPSIRYDLLQVNCEHWARGIVQGERRSSQISGLVGLGSLLLVAYVVSAR